MFSNIDPQDPTTITGTIEFIDRLYEYKSCNNQLYSKRRCSKSIKENDLRCPSCHTEIDQQNLYDDYRATLILITQEGINKFIVYRQTIEEYETQNCDDKFTNLFGKLVTIKFTITEDDEKTAKKIIILENTN